MRWFEEELRANGWLPDLEVRDLLFGPGVPSPHLVCLYDEMGLLECVDTGYSVMGRERCVGSSRFWFRPLGDLTWSPESIELMRAAMDVSLRLAAG